MSDRTCGGCTACCVVLRIAAPLFKAPGTPCRELVQIGPAVGCGIYAARPPVCRDFRCVWLAASDAECPPHMKTRDDERPDLCGLMTGPTDPESNWYKATGIPLLAAYETKPGGRFGYHADRMLKRIAKRTLIAIIPFEGLDKDPRTFIGPARAVQETKRFAARVGGLQGDVT